MADIDVMDIFGFWRVQIWAETHRKTGKNVKDGGPKYIDEALPFL